ncbi:MAG: hypothetical protein FJ265_13175, partial [Planctomycetes bacterium]|nr:hypothetical protein [Planctomycetota bacterium]
MHPQDDSAREAALAATIPLLHHVPARRPFPFESFAPANVRTADDLPPYLLLGALDPKSFAITPAGWSAEYRGH